MHRLLFAALVLLAIILNVAAIESRVESKRLSSRLQQVLRSLRGHTKLQHQGAVKTSLAYEAPYDYGYGYYPKVYKVAQRTTGLSWEDCRRICRSNGFSLCPRRAICPHGSARHSPAFRPGNAWVPVGGDGENAWISVGDNHPFCMRHETLPGGNRPGWGTQRGTEEFKASLYCCSYGPPLISRSRHLMGYSYDFSWQESSNMCKANGAILCNFASVCPKGPKHRPFRGEQSGDSWAPIGGEGSNTWVEVGTGWTVCERHTEINGGRYGRPGWGVQNDRGGQKGPIFCCGRPKKKRFYEMSTLSTGMSWTDARLLCSNNKMELCNFATLCPRGYAHPSVITQKNRDEWIPFDDGTRENSWIQVGDVNNACRRHTEVSSQHERPGWGADRSTGHYKGEVVCCGKKPKPRPLNNIGSSRGNTWDDSRRQCEQRGQQLCTFSDICPNGADKPPVMGNQDHDSWTPILDAGENMWVQIGSGVWPSCYRHTEIHNGDYGRPGWGNDRGWEGFRADIYCCSQ